MKKYFLHDAKKKFVVDIIFLFVCGCLFITRQRRCFSPEEWLPHTLFITLCGPSLQKGILVVTDQELCHVLPTVMKNQTAWALRKVQANPWLIRYLLHKKLLFHYEKTCRPLCHSRIPSHCFK